MCGFCNSGLNTCHNVGGGALYFVDVGPLLVGQILGAIPLPVASSLAIEALCFRLGSGVGFVHGRGHRQCHSS